ncbi:MAG: AMP-binding protein, partial [Chitinophagaceae bacterium]|nr:AMP-binding protein [Chitinophagaceae bacterium]
FFEFKNNQKALLCLPLSFIAGKMMVVRALFSRLNLICVEPGLNPLSSIPPDICIDFAALTPMQFKDTTHTGRVRKILLGGGPISPEMEQQYQSLPAEIYHGFGMTETLSHVAIRRINGVNASPWFQALPGIHFNTDSRGCLIIDAPFLDVPVITNDIVDVVNNQSFQWKGRLDNVINSGGIKLFPEEIEKKLYPLIPERFFVTGLPDDTYGEKVCLIIEGEPYSPGKLSLLQSSLPRYLSKYEKPRAVYFLNKLQITESGKIQRKENTKMVIQGSTY